MILARKAAAFATFTALLIAAPVVLGAIVHPLRPPLTAQPAVLLTVLRGSSLPTDLLLYAAGLAAWGLWAYLVTTTLLRLLLALPAARSATWARLRATSDAITLPVVRRLVDGLVAALILAQTVRPMVVHATPMPATTLVARSVADGQEQPSAIADERIRYWVQPGDSLWAIAERVYGDGEGWRRVFEANLDRPQPDGGRLTAEAVIRPGWVLDLPLPAQTINRGGSGTVQYTVLPGDSLSAIAARLLGDEARWTELWHRNQGREMSQGERFDNPDLLQPGWVLDVPAGPAAVANARAAAPPPNGTPAEPPPAPEVTSPPAASAPLAPEPMPNGSVPSAPTPVPSTGTEPEAMPVPDLERARETPSMAGELVAAAAGAAALSGLLAWRRRVNRRRLLHDDPEPADLPYDLGGSLRRLADGFCAAEVLRLVRQRTRGVETDKVSVTAARLRRALAEASLPEPSLLLAFEAARDVTFQLAIGPEGQVALLDPASTEALEARLGCVVRGRRASGGDLLVELEHLRTADIVSIGPRPADDLWLPIGVMAEGQRLHLNLATVSHLLVAGQVGQDAGALLATLALGAAALPPDSLELVVLRAGDTLPPELDELPHVRQVAAGQDGGDGVEAVLADLYEKLVRRTARDGMSDGPPRRILIVVEELASLSEHSALASLAAQGGACGMHLLVATSGGRPVPRVLLEHLPGRVVLRVGDAEASAHLLGRPGAEELEGGGDVYARVLGREPVRARGFRVEAVELRASVALMRQAAPPLAEQAVARECAYAQPGSAGESETLAPLQQPAPRPMPNGTCETPVVSSIEQPRTPWATAPCVDPEPDGSVELSVEEPLWVVSVPTEQTATQAPCAALEIHCFGHFTVLRDGRPVTTWERRDARELLAYLAVYGRQGISRDQLVEALWPEREPESGTGFLWRRIYMVRKAVGDEKDQPFIHFATGQYRLDPESVWTDVGALEELLARARRASEAEQEHLLAAAADLYTGDLFADHCPDWAIELQDRYRARVMDALNRSAAIAMRRGDARLAIERYRRSLALDPVNEEVAANLARALHLVGDRAGVQRLRTSLLEALRRELDDPEAELQPETAEVFDSILADLVARRPERAGAPE